MQHGLPGRRATAGRLVAILACVLSCACASGPVAPTADFVSLLNDRLFAAPDTTVDADDLFALSAPMRQFVHVDIAHQLRAEGPASGLISALYHRGQLKLEYDAARTRTAAEAFDARKGNCLSLVIMAAAFAKELGLQVTYQSVDAQDTWSRVGDVAFLNGHVNLMLGRPIWDGKPGYDPDRSLIVDFLPGSHVGGMRMQPISERTIVAMYLNNRAAEALVAGRVDQAYWWARAAIVRAPDFPSAYNTLAVVYLHHGELDASTRVLTQLLARNPQDRQALANLANVVERLGQVDRAQALRARLARLEQDAPYHFFELGVAAMRRGDYEAARNLFIREVERADYNSEFHFWLALADFQLGNPVEARRQLAIARDNSVTTAERELYDAKLTRLRADGLQ